MGVYDDRFVRPIAETHARLGTVRALVFHSGDGLDECSIGAPTHVADVKNGEVTEYEIDATTFGLRSASIAELQVRDLDHAATLVRDILENREVGPSLDMTLLNAAAAMVAAGIASSFGEGVDQARKTIRSGAAATTLESLVHASNQA
jgi:anthranilate phosphoribosyltransferase